jgi:hypothetical protein
VPPDFLPLLLDAGKKGKKLRPLILPILGNLGQWLASQNRRWEYGLGAKIADVDLANIQEIWATGSRSERSAALSQWRELQPVESRQALEASWKTEKADDRAAWLEILQIGLSLEDEEFLEVALADRSEPVRHQAAHLLNQIPSQYRQRLTKLANKLLVIQDINDSYQINICLPKYDDPEWIAAGILSKPSGKSGTKQAEVNLQLLLPVLIAADLDIWPQNIDLLVTTLQGMTIGLPILSSLAKAACYQQRVDWMEILINRSILLLSHYDMQTILSSLPSDKQMVKEQLFTQLMTIESSMETLSHYLEIIMHERYWSPTLSSLVLQKFQQYVQQQKYYYYVQQIGTNISSRLNISALPELRQIQATCSSDKFDYSNCVEFLEFRRSIRAVFDTT